MLNETRLTAVNSTSCALTSICAKSARRAALATLGALLAFGSEIEFVAANAPEKARSFATQRLDPRRGGIPRRSSQPEHLQRLPSKTSSAVGSDEIERELAQLEFQFQETQKLGSERLERLTARLSVLLDSARRLATQSAANSELAQRAETLVERLETFRRFVDDSSDFFRRLAKLDAASLNAGETRSFFAAFLEKENPTDSLIPYFNDGSNPSDAVAAYRKELHRVAASLDALETLETWNAFVETNGAQLERFYVEASSAEKALKFIAQTQNRQGLPQEYQALERRAEEWRFVSLNRVAIQRKILLALEAELATKYWTFAPTSDQIYYLQQPPRPGRNVCFVDAQGALGAVDVPENAPETKSSEPTQRLFLQSLASEAQAIPETLRAADAARWYAAWSAFLSRLQTTDRLDPLVQFRLLHSVVSTLASGDYYFAQRLAPTSRMLAVPALVGDGVLDVFQAENVKTQDLRRLAKVRIAFLPTDRLTVDKTTAQLDAQTERFSFAYRQIGWLDRDFSNAWRCRRPENAPLPVGELYVLLPDADDATTESSSVYVERSSTFPQRAAPSASSTRWRWLKIGSSDGRKITLEFAAPDVCRGSIVLCRSRVGASEPVAERDALERLMRR